MKTPVNELLQAYREELSTELGNILSYWINNTCDRVHGGFIGRIDENNTRYPNDPKGAVLNARILWSFSSAYRLTNNDEYLHIARMAYKYISARFVDKTYGGVYWSLTAAGEPLDTRKQVYALAFAIYGCVAYHEAGNSESAKNTAIDLFTCIEKYCYDESYNGYVDAFARDWSAIQDMRLREKDANEKKTMNTHLHVLEAYTALYRTWPDALLKKRIVELIRIFTTTIINDRHHLDLFFDEQWNRRSGIISYGHDIEAAWLLQEAAMAVEDKELLKTTKELALSIAAAAAEGLDNDGGLWYEFDPVVNRFVQEKHWWVQAEAMVGFFNAWQLSHRKTYLLHSLNAWHYAKDQLIDTVNGEWLWARMPDGSRMQGQDKVGLWKCPYHNSRACIELIRRIDKKLSSR